MCAYSCATRAGTEVLRKGGVVPLHTCGGRCVAIIQSAVDDVEATLPLIQPQLEVGSASPRVVLVAPLDVEDSVGRSATDRGKDAIATVYRVEIVPVRENRIGREAGGW